MKRILLLILLCSIFSFAQDKFKKDLSMEGGNSYLLFGSGDTLISVVSETVYYSLNNGRNWNESNLTTIPNSFVKLDDGAILAASDTGIYQSTNLKDWQLIKKIKLSNLTRDKFGTLYAIINSYVYFSRNEGQSWVTLLTPAVQSNDYVYVSGDYVYSTGTGQIFRKKINSDAQYEFFQFFPFSWIRISINGSGKLAAYSSTNKLALSSDSGSSWRYITIRGVANISYASMIDNLLFVVDDQKRILRSDDNGENWFSCMVDFPEFVKINSIYQNNGTLFALTEGEGIYKLLLPDYKWVPVNKGLNGVVINRIIKLKNNDLLAGSYGRGVLRSFDNGISWTEYNDGFDTKNILDVIQTDSEDMFALSQNKLFRYDYDGKNWSSVLIGINGGKLFTYNNIIYLNQQGKINISYNKGETWNTLSSSYWLYMVLGNFGEVYASNRNEFFKLNALQNSWTKLFIVPSTYLYNSINFNGTFYFCSGTRGIYKTNDSLTGVTRLSFINGNAQNIFTDGITNIYYVAIPTGQVKPVIFKSSDKGDSWNLLSDNYWGTGISSISLMNEKIYVGTSKGLYVNEPNILSVKENPLHSYYLSQNYPNPFNPSTTINFSIRKSDYVKIILYDILGNELHTLVNERKEPGSYMLKFNGNGLPSGVYFYRLTSGEYIQTKKMLLLK